MNHSCISLQVTVRTLSAIADGWTLEDIKEPQQASACRKCPMLMISKRALVTRRFDSFFAAQPLFYLIKLHKTLSYIPILVGETPRSQA